MFEANQWITRQLKTSNPNPTAATHGESPSSLSIKFLDWRPTKWFLNGWNPIDCYSKEGKQGGKPCVLQGIITINIDVVGQTRAVAATFPALVGPRIIAKHFLPFRMAVD